MKLCLPLSIFILGVSVTMAVASTCAAEPTGQLFRGNIFLRQTTPHTCPSNVRRQDVAFFIHQKNSRVVVEYIDGTKLNGITKGGAALATGKRNQSVSDVIRVKGLGQKSIRARIQIIWNNDDERCSYIYTGTMRRKDRP